MNHLPPSVQPALRRLRRRLALGLFLGVWPPWAVATLLAAGVAALVCRLFVAAATGVLPWLGLAPVLAVIPAVIICSVRAYRPAEVVALADSLSGGHGVLLTLLEHPDDRWSASQWVAHLSRWTLPRLRPWRALAPIPLALAFFVAALLVPQRLPRLDPTAVMADHIADDLTATKLELKRQDLITPSEEKKLEEEIERIRRGALERMDASSWEAADALKERVAATLSEKRDALKWAQDSLARYAAAVQAGGKSAGSTTGAEAQEFAQALQKLAESGQLAGASRDLQQLASGGTPLPTDAESLRRLARSLSEFLGDRNARFGNAASLSREFGRFDPSEFGLDFNPNAPDGDGDPGSGGVNRGRADAPLTLGNQTPLFDRFKSQALPPGYARSPDDWAPLVVLPGAPRPAPQLSEPAAARAYAGDAGQAAWRRSLAPRHQSAVKKYFEK